ncbi:hypothetical protein [Desulfosporosinus sp. FKB]|uniref:hypothetical protein n=1 Tax=Desulfosporosinus sp. FKB TaxID=1969835 RepID=UPI001482AFD4|nr:hypothetical protein [Desulfosporosinus sp. FKB]
MIWRQGRRACFRGGTCEGTCVRPRSVHTTQSKLTVQATCFGERGSRHKRHPWRYGGGARPVRRPVFGVKSLSRSLLTAYVKTSRCLTLRPWLRGSRNGEDSLIR